MASEGFAACSRSLASEPAAARACCLVSPLCGLASNGNSKAHRRLDRLRLDRFTLLSASSLVSCLCYIPDSSSLSMASIQRNDRDLGSSNALFVPDVRKGPQKCRLLRHFLKVSTEFVICTAEHLITSLRTPRSQARAVNRSLLKFTLRTLRILMTVAHQKHVFLAQYTLPNEIVETTPCP